MMASHQDLKPLEKVPPQLEAADEELLREVAEPTEGDVYGAQLAMAKASKIESAQKLVEKATKDPDRPWKGSWPWTGEKNCGWRW